MLDKATLQQNKQRWQEVAEFEQEEARQSSPLDHWKKLNALYGMAADLNLAIEANLQEEGIVWHRWNKLREIYIGSDDTC